MPHILKCFLGYVYPLYTTKVGRTYLSTSGVSLTTCGNKFGIVGLGEDAAEAALLSPDLLLPPAYSEGGGLLYYQFPRIDSCIKLYGPESLEAL